MQALVDERGGATLAIEADVTGWADLERAVAQTRTVFGPLDAVLANAGADRPQFWTNGVPEGPILHENDVVRAVLYAMSQPPYMSINELLIRPTGQGV